MRVECYCVEYHTNQARRITLLTNKHPLAMSEHFNTFEQTLPHVKMYFAVLNSDDSGERERAWIAVTSWLTVQSNLNKIDKKWVKCFCFSNAIYKIDIFLLSSCTSIYM